MIKTMLIATATLIGVTGVAVAQSDDRGDEKKQVKRIVIYNHDGTHKDIDIEKISAEATGCKMGDERVASEAETDIDGRKTRTRIVLCGDKRATVLAALEKARANMSREAELQEAHRAKAIEALDREIERLKQAGATN